MSLLKTLGDNSDPHSLATKMRRRRFAFFLSLLERVKRPVRVLDVGGTREFWELMGDGIVGERNLHDVSITLLNRGTQPTSGKIFESIAGDARDLSRFDDQSFDVVFSNSVIEHLGPEFSSQQLMAEEVRRVGKRYFVQTPNRYFPIEPHFLTPGFQFFPVSVRVWLVTHFEVGWYRRFSDRSEAEREVTSISLLTKFQLRQLFPEAHIHQEKFGGLTKSFVAYYGWHARTFQPL
ncbi:MAG: methyltransferase domain-containing protein [Gemmatimonadaceae bacterium]